MEHQRAFAQAIERYAALGVDVEQALTALAGVSLSLHCWQGDDVAGFESPQATLSGGGIVATGNYPGRARTPDELRADLAQALSLLPGRHRVNLHAIYGDFGPQGIARENIRPEHFAPWVEWARGHGLGLDFNATCFSHPQAASGYTLSSRDEHVRRFWIDHVQRCREIAAGFGERLGTPAVMNLWIPDGSKDLTVSRHERRALLLASLEEIYRRRFPREQLLDTVEAKLFGIGTESFVVGSHEFYLGWALKHDTMLCLDLGHFHPTESVADKVSALLLYVPELLFHVSRGIRWDSDHVVIFDDELRLLMEEIVRAAALSRVRFALDFFDASINRVGAWVIGARATQKALLAALLEPTARLREYERRGDHFARLALLEELKTWPLGTVWDEFCRRHNVPPADRWIAEVHDYEQRVLAKRK